VADEHRCGAPQPGAIPIKTPAEPMQVLLLRESEVDGSEMWTYREDGDCIMEKRTGSNVARGLNAQTPHRHLRQVASGRKPRTPAPSMMGTNFGRLTW
jgi:hypothetical protein